MSISTFVTGKSPYKNVLVNDLVLDKEGKKMSKSKGNTVAPMELFEKYGADALRYYILYVSPPWIPTKFNEEDIKEVQTKFFRTIRNIYNFLFMYANADKLELDSFFIEYEKRPEIDKWLLSKYNRLVDSVNKDMEIYEVNRVIKNIQYFLVEDFSNWYIRRCRRRFWKSETDDDKLAVYNTTYEVLLGLTKLIAPFTPFIAEELYRNLTGKKTVHLERYPECDESLLNEKIENRMDLVRELVSLGRISRENAGIKVRQPLKEVIIEGKYRELIEDLKDLIKEELNVKEVIFRDDLTEYMDYTLKPNYKEAGKILGSKIKSFAKYLNEVDAKNFVAELDENGKANVELNGEETEILKDYVLISINSKKGFDVSKENNLFIILDTQLTEELISEGYVREIISKIQQLRKKEDLDVLDNIDVFINTSEEVQNALNKNLDFIKSEVLANSIEFTGEEYEEFDINGVKSYIKIERK